MVYAGEGTEIILEPRGTSVVAKNHAVRSMSNVFSDIANQISPQLKALLITTQTIL